MAACVTFGGGGHISTHVARRLPSSERFGRVHLADLNPAALASEGASASITYVCESIPEMLTRERPEWIFKFAAVHSESGQEAHEYFRTNLAGA